MRTSNRSLFAFCTFFAALAPAAGACVSSSTTPSPGAGDSGSGSGSGGSSSGSSSSGSGSGSSSSGSGSGSSSSGSSSSGSSSGGGTDDAGGATCTWSVTGGATATGTCYAVGVYATDKNAMEFGVSPLSETASPSFTIAVDLGTTLAAMQPGTYTTTNALNANGTFYSGSGASMAVWVYKDDDGGADGGMTLTLTSVGASTVVDGGTVWNGAHGTLSVTMNPELNATAAVTGTATF